MATSIGAVPDTAIQTRKRMLGILMLVYTLSYVDRTIIGTVGEAIKHDLLLTDTQLGMLHGLSFSILYIGLTIPFARFAERRNRVSLISGCVLFWSLCTTALGLVSSFVGLFVTRILVGVGEAGTTPASQSMIADVYAPSERGRALGVLAFGVPMGMLIGGVVGGLVTQHFGWRAAFLVLGIPGIALGLILRLIVKDPPRGLSENKHLTADQETPSFVTVFWRLVKSPAIVHIAMGKAIATTFIYCSAGFSVPFLIRAFGLDIAKAGTTYGLAVGIGYGSGALLGAHAIDRLSKRDSRWYGWLPAGLNLLACPIFLAAYLQSNWIATAILLCLGSMVLYASIPPGTASFHNRLEPNVRATSTSVLFVMENVIPLAAGPILLGLLIDMFAHQAFADVVTGGNFAASCPGGAALKDATAQMATACRESLAGGTRYSLVALSILPIWACVHYLLHVQRKHNP